MKLVGRINEPEPDQTHTSALTTPSPEAAALTASQLRADVYNILDRVLATGESAMILRNGRTLRIVPDFPRDRLANLPDRSHLYPDGVDDLHEFKTPYEWNEGEPTP